MPQSGSHRHLGKQLPSKGGRTKGAQGSKIGEPHATDPEKGGLAETHGQMPPRSDIQQEMEEGGWEL